MRSEFWKKVSQVTLGTIISQLVVISSTPILSRLYSPESFGILGTFVSIVSVASIITKLGYDRAIMVIESKYLVNLLLLILAVVVFLNSTIIAVVTAIFEKDISLYLIFLGILILSFTSILDILLPRFSLFKELSFLKVFRSVSMVLSQISLFSITSKYGLIIGMLLGNLFTLFISSFIYSKQVGFKLRKISLKLSKILLFNLSDFPKYSVWGTFLNALSLSSVILLMGLFFSKSIVGSFFLTYRLLQFPLALIGQAIGITFFQEFSKHIRKKDLRNAKSLFYLLERKLALIGALPFAVLTVFGDKILIWFLGEKWHTAGTYTKCLSPWLYLVFIYSPLSNVYNSLRKQKIFLLSQILFISSRVSAVIVGGYFLKDDIFTVLLIGIIGVLLIFLLQAYTHTFVLKLKFADFLNILIFYPVVVLFLLLNQFA